MLLRILNRFGWWVVRSTEETDLRIVFIHLTCRSREVVPIEETFNWNDARFECLGCGNVTGDVICKVVSLKDETAKEGSSVLYYRLTQ